MRKAERKAKRGLIQTIRFLFPSLEPQPRFQGSLNRVLILAQEKMGDAILLTSLVALLRQIAPKAVIDIAAMSPVKSPVFSYYEHDSHIRHVYHVKANYFRFLRQAGKQRYDVLINTKDHPSFNFLLITCLIPARFKAGIAHAFHDGFFHWMADFDFHRPMVEKYHAFAGFFGYPVKTFVRPYIPDGPVSEDVQVWVRENQDACIGINLSAGQPKREWPVEAWQNLLKNLDAPVVVFAMPDRLQDKQMLEKTFGCVRSTPVTRSIFDVAALMRPLSLLITPDTSLIHVASCVQTPVVGLYTAETVHQSRFAPFGIPFERVLSETKNVRDIPVRAVEEGVRRLRERKRQEIRKKK